MNGPVSLRALFVAAPLAMMSFAAIAETTGPKIGTLEWEEAETVCEVWPEGVLAKDARASGLSWVAYPAAVKPFGMRSYMSIDGFAHPLRQIAYAKVDGTLSVYYRTPGDRHYDVYLTLNGLDANALKGADLTGKLVASRFGLYSEINVAGSCGMALN
ncbi:MAG: hypothetical protein ACRCU5_10500 [Rhizobiaceae bacterium]